MHNMDWNLRAELFRAAHRWPVVMLSFLVGSLLGVILSYILPFQYQAEAGLSVSYQSDAIFRNVDDYKNWELGQLEAIIFSDEILDKTIARLAANDNNWQGEKASDIRPMLNVYWRNAGNWRLTIKADSSQYASQFVHEWREVILEEVTISLDKAQDVLKVNAQLQAAALAQVDLDRQINEYSQIKSGLESWQAQAAGGETNKPLDTLERWRLYAYASRLDVDAPAGRQLLESFPGLEDTTSSYIDWSKAAVVSLQVWLEGLQAQKPELDARLTQLTQQFPETAASSRWLTAYLHVDKLNEEIQPPKPVRNHGLAALAGGVLGFLTWAAFWLAAPALRRKS